MDTMGGTSWETTHRATFYNPSFMPGYKGHVPTLKHRYGDTFGSGSAQYFIQRRSRCMEDSANVRGGTVPTFFTNRPDLLWDARCRGRRGRFSPDGREGGFYQRAQAHRLHYKDRCHSTLKVPGFDTPRDYARARPY